MNLIQKMGFFGSKLNVLLHSAKVLSTHNKIVNEFKNLIAANASPNIKDEDIFSHSQLPSEIDDNFLKVDYDEYLAKHYHVLINLLKKYKRIIENLFFGTGRKFANKTDDRIEKARLQNNEEDIKYYEEEKENVGNFLMDIVSDYEYYYNLFNLINVQLLGRENTDLSLD